MDVKVTMDIAKVKNRIESATREAIFLTSEHALEDCNYYCKQDQDALISSSENHSDFENGLLIWKEPYARMQYYLDATRLDKNPNARKMWAHHAESVHGEEWRQVFDDAFKEFAREE